MRLHWLKPKNEEDFWHRTVVLFALLAVAVYLPALRGHIPFPGEVVLQFPAWNNSSVRPAAFRDFADIGDLITAFYPERVFTARTIHEGSLPLWNPYLLGGAPFLANPQSSLFYPPNFLYYVLPVPVAWTLCLMLRVFLSGVFMTLFVRYIGGTRLGSVFSGIAFAFCGFLTAWQGQPMADSAAWLPLMCYAVLRLADSDSNTSIAFAAFVFAMPVLAGHPETAAHVTLAAIALALVTCVCSPCRLRFAYRFAVSGILAAGIASIQMIPTLEWLSQMPKAFDRVWPVLPFHQALTWVSRDIVRSPNSAGLMIPEAAAYAGMITLIAAPLGLIHRAGRQTLYLCLLVLAALAIAYGIEPAHSLVAHVPVLASIKNSRMIFLAGFGIAALAGLGISVLEEHLLSGHRRIFALSILAASISLVFLMVYALRLSTEFPVELLRRAYFSRALLVAAALPLLARLYGRLSAWTFSTVACAVLALDLLTCSYGYMGEARRDQIFPKPPVVDFLERNTDPARFRTARIGDPYTANANLVYGIASPDGYEVQLTERHHAFSLDYTADRLDGIAFIADHLLQFNDRRLDLLNVKYLVVWTESPDYRRLLSSGRFLLAYNNSGVAVFENRTALPRGLLVPANGMKVMPVLADQVQALRNPEFNPRVTFTVSKVPDTLQQPLQPGTGSSLPLSNAAEVVDAHVNELTVRYASSEQSVLILSQTYYPGWRAEVDGRRAELFPVDVSLTGIAAPAGLHEVRILFRPLSLALGAALTLLAITVSLLLLRGSSHDFRSKV